MPFRICMIGSIPKGDGERKGWTDWKTEYKNKLSVLNDVEFADGDAWRDETMPFLLVGHDLHRIKISDLVVVIVNPVKVSDMIYWVHI